MLDSDYGATKRLGGVASSPRPFTPVWLAQEEAGQKNQVRYLICRRLMTAQSMLVRSAKWSCLKAWAMKIARHRGMNKAKE
jgi:hypothetical protein